MNILLTGSSGFVGSHFHGDKNIKRVVVRKNVKCDQWLCDKYVIDALNHETEWAGAFEGIDVIIHLAGLAHSKTFTSEDYQQVNVDGTLRLASSAATAGVKRFVFVSSIGVHGGNTTDTALTSESPVFPDNDYTRSKLKAEKGLKRISKETGLEIVIVRPTLVYGANAPGNFGLLTKLVDRIPVLPFRGIANKRDFISVQNLTNLLICCAKHPEAKNSVFLASDGETVSIGEFIELIAFGLNRNILLFPVPLKLFRFVGTLIKKTRLVEQLVGSLQVDNSDLKRKLGWEPPYSMREAMSKLNKGQQ